MKNVNMMKKLNLWLVKSFYSNNIIKLVLYNEFIDYVNTGGTYELYIMKEVKEIIDEKYKSGGYNVGINIGEPAGQAVMHLHMHFIPRYKGDVENPRGGIRKLKRELVEYDG